MVRFPALKSSLHLTKTGQVVKAPHVFQKRRHGQAMNGKNRLLGIDEPLSLRNTRFKFKSLRRLPIGLEESMEHTSNSMKE